MVDEELLDPVLLRVLQDALINVAEAMTGVAEATPVIEEQLDAMAVIREGVERAIRSLVAEARADGLTWAEIGQALHVTRQSAHERYADGGDDWFWI